MKMKKMNTLIEYFAATLFGANERLHIILLISHKTTTRLNEKEEVRECKLMLTESEIMLVKKAWMNCKLMIFVTECWRFR